MTHGVVDDRGPASGAAVEIVGKILVVAATGARVLVMCRGRKQRRARCGLVLPGVARRGPFAAVGAGISGPVGGAGGVCFAVDVLKVPAPVNVVVWALLAFWKAGRRKEGRKEGRKKGRREERKKDGRGVERGKNGKKNEPLSKHVAGQTSKRQNVQVDQQEKRCLIRTVLAFLFFLMRATTTRMSRRPPQAATAMITIVVVSVLPEPRAPATKQMEGGGRQA